MMDAAGSLLKERNFYPQAHECATEANYRCARTRSWQNASQFAGTPVAKFAKGLISQLIQPAVSDVLLDLAVEPACLKLFEPGPKFGQIFRRELFDCFFDVFDCHVASIPYEFTVCLKVAHSAALARICFFRSAFRYCPV